MKITATEGNVFKRIHDGFIMGPEIELGIDFSTGTAREDKEENYKQIPIDIWHDDECALRIIAPLEFVNYYPQLLFDLTVVRKLHIELEGDKVLIYANTIVPEYQQMIDGSNGLIYIENKA